MHDKSYLLDVPIELVAYNESLALVAPILLFLQSHAREILSFGCASVMPSSSPLNHDGAIKASEQRSTSLPAIH